MAYSIEKELVCNGCKHLWHSCAKCTALGEKKTAGGFTWREHKPLNSANINKKKYVLRDANCPGFVKR